MHVQVRGVNVTWQRDDSAVESTEGEMLDPAGVETYSVLHISLDPVIGRRLKGSCLRNIFRTKAVSARHSSGNCRKRVDLIIRPSAIIYLIENKL